jgi:N-acyl-D-amino-acid deacylase
MGMAQRPPTAAEQLTMGDLVRSAMQAGYFGVSSGLVTPPSVYADTEDLVELARVVAEHGGMYASHIRGEGHSLLRATAEALEVGERSGARVQISHHKATFRAYWGRVRQAIQLSEWATQRGQSVGFDVYPYAAGSANLTQIIPDWAHEGGLNRLLERLREPATRERVRADVIEQNREWDQTFVAWVPSSADQAFLGASIAAIAERRGPDPIDALFAVLDESAGEAAMVHLVMDGTYPRVLGHDVRDEQVLSLEDAVRTASYRPAERLGLPAEGRLQVAADADLVTFDPATIEDSATVYPPAPVSPGH